MKIATCLLRVIGAVQIAMSCVVGFAYSTIPMFSVSGTFVLLFWWMPKPGQQS